MTKTPVAFAAALLLAGWALVTLGSQETGGGDGAVTATLNDKGYKQVEAIDMTFEWKVVGEELDIVLSSPTEGWLAVGFDPSQVMMDADIYIGTVNDDGTASVRDDFGTWYTSHEPDEELGGSSDVRVVEAEESAEGSRIRFRIPLDSGDQYDAVLEPGTEHVVMLAYHDTDDIGRRHRDRIKFTVTL